MNNEIIDFKNRKKGIMCRDHFTTIKESTVLSTRFTLYLQE